MIEDYLRHNLYMDTSKGQLQDALNRHVLVHGFESQVDYNLSNFLKIYNTVMYLAWAFAESDPSIPKRVLLENEDILYKWSSYEKLKLLTVITDPIKIQVYSKNPNFDATDFNFQPVESRRFTSLDLQKPILNELDKVDNLLTTFYPGTRNI